MRQIQFVKDYLYFFHVPKLAVFPQAVEPSPVLLCLALPPAFFLPVRARVLFTLVSSVVRAKLERRADSQMYGHSFS